jgi:hypothetical protein
MSTVDHAPFGPSGIHQIIQCPGSWKMQRMYPRTLDTDQTEAMEGTAAHWVIAEQSAGRQPKRGDRAPNGVAVTDEMLDGADLWFDTVGQPQHVEERLPSSPDIDPDNWGTPDGWSWMPEIITIDVSDYKFGRRFVDVFENWQLINYALLIIDGVLKLDGMQDQHVKIRFRIVQPRSYHPQGPVREWTCRACDLRGARNQIRAAIEQARGDNPLTRVGDACRDCSARAHCGTLQRASFDALAEVGRITPIDLPPAAVGIELRILNDAIKVLRARHTGLSEVALAAIRTGNPVSGHRAESAEGRLKWKVPVSQIQALEQMFPGVTLTQPEPITPKQAIKAGVPAEIIDSFSERHTGELKLIEDDGSLTRRLFGGQS